MATIIGTKNGETLWGTAADDLIQGQGGNDSLYGQEGKDQLDGGKGDDFLDGGSGNDQLTGGDGNDTLYGGGGKDQLDGGAGIDLLGLDLSGEGAGVVFDGARRTHLSLKNGTSAKNGEQFDVSGTNFGDTLVGANLDDRFSGNDGDDSLVGRAGHDFLDGGSGNDTLTGGVGDDALYGGDGNDLIDGGEGADSIHAGDGNDTVLYDAEDVFIDGGPGNDTLNASGSGAGVTIDLANGPYSSFETVIGSAHDDNLIGDASANTLNGDAGNDILKGNGGSDRFVLSAGNDMIMDFEGAGSTASVLLDFEIAEGSSYTPLYGYKGLTWHESFGLVSWASDATLYGTGTGEPIVLTSGKCIGEGSYLSGFSDPNQDFDFASGNFAGFYTFFDSQATINAYDDGALVGSAVMGLIGSSKAIVDFAAQTAIGVSYANFSGRFESVDTIEFVPTVGPLPMDDLVLNYASQDDKIDVPDGFDVAGFIGSATSDGNGGTVLTHDQGSLHLIGIDLGTVSADWFV